MKPRLRTALIILFLIVSLIPPVEGNGWPEEQTRHIETIPPEQGKDADWFVTEAGIGFSSTLVTVLDPNMDIYGYLFFKDMKLNSYFLLENATLRLHTASSMDFDADSSFTIYGINDYRHFGLGNKDSWGYGSPASIMNAPLTSAHVNYNSSQFYGGQWWDIDVTNIVQEFKSNPGFEGPGLIFNNPGANMGFIIFGAGGYDTRYFYDLSAGNGKEAQLHLHWDFSPPPPSGWPTAIFTKTYRNFTIWEILGGQGYSLDPMEYIFTNYTADPYYVAFDNSTGFGPSFVGSSDDVYIATYHVSARKVVRTGNGTLYAVYNNVTGIAHRVNIEKSLDGGATWPIQMAVGPSWDDASKDSGSTSMAVDSNSYLHVVWSAISAGKEFIYYSYYDGVSWSAPLMISDGVAGMSTTYHYTPAIAVDSADNLHVVWSGFSTAYPPANSQIWHRVYNRTSSTWNTPTRVSDYAGMENDGQQTPGIAIDSNDYLHVVWKGEADGFVVQKQTWYNRYTTSWAGPIRISTAPGMQGLGQSTTSISVDSLDNTHVALAGLSTAHPTDYQIYYTKGEPPQEVADWTTPLRLSTDAPMDNWDDLNPSIAPDSGDNITVIWNAEPGDMYSVFYNGTAWSDPSTIQTNIGSAPKRGAPSLRWARWPIGGPSTYLVTDANGTILETDLETVEDAEEWIELYEDDPEDPDPGGDWSEGPGGATGPFSRFRIRLYLLILGFGCIFGPVLFFSWRRPTGYYLLAGALVMMAGLGLLMAIGDI